MSDFEQILIVVFVGILLTLVLFGLIGPNWLRKRMRKFNIWGENPTGMFPIDPYETKVNIYWWVFILVTVIFIIFFYQ